MKNKVLIKLVLLAFSVITMFTFVSCSSEPFIAYDVEGGSQGLMYQKNSLFVPGYQVVGIGECKDTDIVIPAKVNGKDVTVIGDYAFANCSSITSVTLPSTVVSIWQGAFAGCTSLKTVKTHDKLNVINREAFKGCTSLENFDMPNNIHAIHADTFDGCTALDIREYDNAYYFGNKENPYLVLLKAKDNKITSCLVHPDTKVIAQSAFGDCGNLESIELPDTVWIINGEAFKNCVQLKSINIPESIAKIDSGTFRGCVSLRSITIPESVTQIMIYAFEGCSSLTDIKYNGTMAQWQLMYKASGYFKDEVPATKVICSDGTVSLR